MQLIETLQDLIKSLLDAIILLHFFSVILLQRNTKVLKCSMILLELLDGHVLLLLHFSDVNWCVGNEPRGILAQLWQKPLWSTCKSGCAMVGIVP